MKAILPAVLMISMMVFLTAVQYALAAPSPP
jgi:hypothetical protein